MPSKILWVRRQRVLRRLLKKYRAAKKIDRTIYHKFYLASKGNQYKNRTVLIEAIFKEKSKKIENKKLEDQQEARRQKNQERRKKRTEKQERLWSLLYLNIFFILTILTQIIYHHYLEFLIINTKLTPTQSQFTLHLLSCSIFLLS